MAKHQCFAAVGLRWDKDWTDSFSGELSLLLQKLLVQGPLSGCNLCCPRVFDYRFEVQGDEDHP